MEEKEGEKQELTVEGRGKKRLSRVIRDFSGKFEEGGGGDLDSQPGGRGGDDSQVRGGLGGEGMMKQLSFSTNPKLSKFTQRENSKNNIVDNAGVKRKGNEEDSGEQRNMKYPKFNSYFDH